MWAVGSQQRGLPTPPCSRSSPGLLLVLSVVGLLVKDAAVTEQMVSAISAAVPPLEPVVRAAFEQVSAGAVPTGIVAVIGLLWGSSRFYASLDYAFTKIFHAERRRNELERGARGILVSAVFVALPILLIIAGSVIALVLDIAPGGETWSVLNAVMVLGNPLATVALFIGGTALIYRFVPTANVTRRAYGRPAILTGLVLALFTQLFAFIAPRMLGWAALFGALVAVFALLVWMSISLNMLLLGACWTRVRLAVEEASVAPAAAHGTEPQGR